MRRKSLSLMCLLLLGIGAWWLLRSPSTTSGPPSAVNQSAAQTLSKKLAAVVLPEASSGGGQTEFTESEINAFLRFEISQHYPQGVRQVRVRFQENAVSARALVNFDEMQSDSNRAVDSLVGVLLRGEHWLEVSGKLAAKNGLGRYDILGVWVDHQEIPKLLIDLLLTHYVLPKYPWAKPNTDFNLPFNIQSIELVPGKVSVRYGA